MLAITENIADASARRPAIGILRLQLKSAHRSCGIVQGAVPAHAYHALQQWESDGGAMPPPRSQAQLQDA